MRIESAQIAARSQHLSIQRSVRSESMDFWLGGRRPDNRQAAAPLPKGDTLSLTPQASATQPVRKTLGADELDTQLSPRDQLLSDILRLMFKALTGEEAQILSPRELADKIAQTEKTADAAGSALQQSMPSQPPPSAGFGLAYDHYESHYEYESLDYSAEGTIKTQDGQELQFSVQINISREFYSENRQSLRLGDAARKIDPLVVNFAGNAAELSDTKFQFDLDSDGRKDQISLLQPGSGWLALDKNRDGGINDGSELFGAKTGNGFGELAAYDQDGNGFIDEGDSIFDKLRIWTTDSQGRSQLAALGAYGIGAVYLGHLASPFDYKDSNNATQGDIASTGLFIRENGSAGTIQQIDYAA